MCVSEDGGGDLMQQIARRPDMEDQRLRCWFCWKMFSSSSSSCFSLPHIPTWSPDRDWFARDIDLLLKCRIWSIRRGKNATNQPWKYIKLQSLIAVDLVLVWTRLPCMTSRCTNSGLMPYIVHAWGDTNIWEAYFRCETCLNKSDIFMGLVTLCSARRIISQCCVTSLKDAEVASQCLLDTSQLYWLWENGETTKDALFNTPALVSYSQWTTLILSFQWKLMEQFTRWAHSQEKRMTVSVESIVKKQKQMEE